MSQQEYKLGILYTAGSYVLWGILPLYWKMVQVVPAVEILAHRIVWSFLFIRSGESNLSFSSSAMGSNLLSLKLWDVWIVEENS